MIRLRARPSGSPIDLMKTEVIYNQLVQEFADNGAAPFDEIVLDQLVHAV